MTAPATSNGTKLFHRHWFSVAIPGITLGYFSQCRGLEVEVETFEYVEGGLNDFVHHLPTRVRHPHLELTRGLTKEDALLKWFWATRQKAELKEVTVTLFTVGNQERRVWSFIDAYPIRWSGPSVDAASADIGTETLQIAHSGLREA